MSAIDAKLDWNRVLPSVAATHRSELHLVCGPDVLFFDPSRGVGCIWRPYHQIAHTLGPITAPEFVRWALKRGVAMPFGDPMRAWSSAITDGLIVVADALAFGLVADEMDRISAAPEGGGPVH